MINNFLDTYKDIISTEVQEKGTTFYYIKPHSTILKDEMIELLGQIYDIENDETFKDVFILKFKGLGIDLITEAFRYSLSREDLKNPSMLLNIINLIKIYNTLDDSFFENEDVFVSSIEELLDVKFEIHNELQQFIRQVSIYFMSLFKSYNKTTYSPLDNHIKLPSIYAKIFLSLDLLTLSGIFSVSPKFTTDDCVYIEESMLYISNIMRKNIIAMGLMNTFLKGIEDGNCEEW